MPVLGAAGLSLTLASGACAASSTPAADVCLAAWSITTFHVFDKESPAGERRLACGCGGGCCLFAGAPSSAFGNDAYSPPPAPPIRAAHKHVRKKAIIGDGRSST